MRFRGETSSGQQPKTKKTLLALALGLLALGTSTVTGIGGASATASCVVSGVTNNAGTVTFEIHYSDNTAGCSWTVPAEVTSIKAAVVGAGGAGGSVQQPGGGGGGAVLYNPTLATTPGSAIPVTIGQGVANVYNVQARGATGGSTTFSDVTAQGGGGGGSGNQYQTGNWLGGASGSTGGASRHGRTVTAVSHPTYSGWTLYANPGGVGSGVINTDFPAQWNGDSNALGSGGGGGGAGGPGIDGTTVVNGSNVTVTGGNGGPGIYLLGKCLGSGAPSISSHTSSTTVTRSSLVYMTYVGTSTVSGTWGSTTDCVDLQGNTVVGSASAGGMNANALANTGSAIGADTISSDTNMVWKSGDGNVLISYVVPTPAITSASITNVQKPIISGTGVDGNTISVSVAGASYTATVASGAWSVNLNTATPVSGTLALNVNGTNTVTASATNADGGVSSNVTQTLTIDTTAPATPTLPSVPTLTNQNNRQINFTSEAGSSPQCSFDSGTYAACTSPYSTGTLADGSHTIRVKTVDAAGNFSGIGTYTWTLDTTPPNQPNIATTAAYQTTKSPTITFSADAGTSLSCRMDTNVATTCTSSTTMVYSNLSEGSHIFTVYSADPAGNASSRSYAFSVDTVIPNVPVISTSGAFQTVSSLSLVFTSDVTAGTQCSIDGGAYATCTSPFSSGTLAEGSHTFQVRGLDAAGNTSSAASYSWTQDTIAPTAPSISNSAAYLTTTSASISFTASAGTTTCSIDNATYTSCTSPLSTGTLDEGSHTVRIKTADTAGNVSSIASYTWIQDSIAPTTPVIANSGAYATTNGISVTFTADVAAPTQCSLDGATFTTCSSPYATGTLAEGSHSIRVKSTDSAGNISSIATYNWTQDTIAPTAPTISNTAQYIRQTYVTISYTRSVGTTTCQLDSNAPTTCSNTTVHYLNMLTDGAHTIRIATADAAGNTSSASYSFTVDTIAPAVAVFDTLPTITNSSTSSLGFTTDAGVSVTCSLDGAAFASCVSPFLTGSLLDGNHSLAVQSTDLAGNVSGVQTHTWTIDTVAPVAGIIANSANYVTNTALTVTFSVSEGTASCQLDSGSVTSCTSSTSMEHTGLSEGAHTFTLISTDEAGNTSSSTYNFTVDTVAPVAPTKATENAGPTDRTSSNGATFNFTVPSGATAQCRLETTQAGAFDWTTCTSGTSLSSLTLGTYRFSVRSVDAAGNLSTPITYDWEVVPPGPAAPGITFSGNVVTLSGAATGANGDRYETKIVDANDNIVSPWGTVTASFALRQSNGNYRVYARLVDDNETIGTVASLGVTVTEQPAPAAGSTPRVTISSNSGYSNQSNLGLTIDWPVGTKSVRVMSTQNSNNGSGTTSPLATGWVSANGHRGKNWNFTPAGVPTVTATHQLTVEFLDAAGAVINTQISSVIIDVQAPTLTSAIPTAIDGSNLPIQVSATDEAGGSGLGGIVVTRTVTPVASAASVSAAALVEQEYSIVNGYVTIPNVTLGETMTVRVKDRAGNLSDTSYTVAALNRQTLSPVAKFTGTAKVGQTLKASPGVWPTTHVVTYQWLADGVNIAGATKNSYKLTNAEAGKRITVAVTGTRATYYPVVVTAPASAAVIGGTLTPGTPTLTGTTTVGQTLTATAGNWVNNPTLTYAWKRGTTTVGTELTYTLTNLDAGQKLTFTVTAAKTGFTTVVKTLTTAMITGGTITEQSVTITSAVVAGKKVYTANTAAWSPSGVTLTYQWLKNGTPIAKATAKTYTATPADLGQNLSVTITGKKTGFTTRIVTSLETLVQ